ncbi:glycosyltransferase family 2 protein [Brevibacillus sp. H7]|uniref:glycosyltransferase family 2 protein n=1 Tax=Brevibacillus sp. H7 TaxID=3349138 RepID=UPI0037FCFA1B
MNDHTPPLVSIVIPCYNYGKYLEEAIDSCLASSFKDIEIIVVNDGSTDPDTFQVLKKLNKPKTRVIHQPNRGASAARNAGVRVARGIYIYPLDADDTIHPSLLAKEVAILNARPKVGFVSSWMRCFGHKNLVIKYGRYNFYRLIFRNMIVSGSMFRKKAWKQVGGYNEKLKGYEDWDFWISLGEKGWLGYIIPEPLFQHRKHGWSKYCASRQMNAFLIRQIRKNHPALYSKKRLALLRRIWLPNSIRAQK